MQCYQKRAISTCELDQVVKHCITHALWCRSHAGFFEALQEEAVPNAADPTAIVAQRMWTSTLQLRGREFCFILNAIVRDDDSALAAPLGKVARAINELCVTVGAGSQQREAKHPPDSVRPLLPTPATEGLLKTAVLTETFHVNALSHLHRSYTGLHRTSQPNLSGSLPTDLLPRRRLRRQLSIVLHQWAALSTASVARHVLLTGRGHGVLASLPDVLQGVVARAH